MRDMLGMLGIWHTERHLCEVHDGRWTLRVALPFSAVFRGISRFSAGITSRPPVLRRAECVITGAYLTPRFPSPPGMSPSCMSGGDRPSTG